MTPISKRQTICDGIVVVRKEAGQCLYLLLKVYNYIEPPKGHVLKGESDLDAAYRETSEESGITKDELDFKWGQDYYETEQYGRENKVARFFLAETTQDKVVMSVNPDLGKPEHTSYYWVTYEQASKMVGARIQKVLDWAHNKIGE